MHTLNFFENLIVFFICIFLLILGISFFLLFLRPNGSSYALEHIVSGTVLILSAILLYFQREKTRRMAYAKEIDTDEILKELAELRRLSKDFKKANYSLGETTEIFEQMTPGLNNIISYATNTTKHINETAAITEEILHKLSENKTENSALKKDTMTLLLFLNQYLNYLHSETMDEEDFSDTAKSTRKIYDNLIALLKHEYFIVISPKKASPISELQEGTYQIKDVVETTEEKLNDTIEEVVNIGLLYKQYCIKTTLIINKYKEGDSSDE